MHSPGGGDKETRKQKDKEEGEKQEEEEAEEEEEEVVVEEEEADVKETRTTLSSKLGLIDCRHERSFVNCALSACCTRFRSSSNRRTSLSLNYYRPLLRRLY